MKKVLFLMLALLGIFLANADDNSAWIGEMFGNELTNAKGEKVDPNTLKGKIVGLYFSAHWCPPCRQFTPQLVKFRNEMVKNNKEFEIVFISSDRSEKDMFGYMTETKMQWLAVPFGSASASGIRNKYSVGGIPTLIIVGPDGSTITSNGRGDVTRKPGNALNIWENKFKNGSDNADDGGKTRMKEKKETSSSKTSKKKNGSKKKSDKKQ